MSRIRTNIITNRMANGAPTVSNGLVISGITTTSEITDPNSSANIKNESSSSSCEDTKKELTPLKFGPI